MLSFILTRGLYLSSKLKTSEVLNKSYDQLVTLVAKKYGNHQFKHSNTAALYQIQHHYRVISPGDYILDLGAGPQFRWTQLALELSENDSNSHKVISNDKVQCKMVRPNNIFVCGNFLQEQIRTKIGLALQDRKLNTILCDVSPQFTGQIEEDSSAILQVVQEAFLFSNVFLQKGGNMVCKVLSSQNANLIEQAGKLLFHECYSYRPSVIRERSPIKFLVFKGFSVNHQLEALRQFYSRYRGSSKNKMEVVNTYKGRYNWDPVDMIRRRAKNDILELKLLGRTDRQIQNMFQNDPFININEIMKQVRQLDKAKKEGDQVRINKAINAFTDGKIFNQTAQVPQTREQWITFIEDMQAKLKQNSKDNKRKQSFEPLGDNEVYMKNQNTKAAEEPKPIYIEQDLTGDYELIYENAFIERQIEKYGQLLTKTKDNLQDGQEFELGKNIKLSEVFKKRYQKQQNIQPLHQMAEELRIMTDEQFKKQSDEQGYDKEIEQNIAKSNKGLRNKFKNR